MRIIERLLIASGLISFSYFLFIKQQPLGISYLSAVLLAYGLEFYYEGIRVPFYLQTLHQLIYLTLVVGLGT